MAQAGHGTGSGRRTIPTMSARRQATLRRRRFDLAERFVAQHQPLLPRRRAAVAACDDFPIGSTHAERHSAHQHRTVGERRFRNVIEPCRIGDAGPDSDCAHRFLLNYTESSLCTSLDDTLCPAAAKSSDQVRNENCSTSVDDFGGRKRP